MNGKSVRCNEYRIVVLGASGVGKSALVVRYLTKRFIWEYDPTLECTYRHQAVIDDDQVGVEILDTAGQIESCIREGHIRWGEGFLLVYSLADRETLAEAIRIKQQIDEIKKPKTSLCVMIGNKSDLDYERCVSSEEGAKVAEEMCCGFLETSALAGGEMIGEAFLEILREVKRRRTIEFKPRRRSSTSQVKQVFNKMFTKIQNG